MSVSSAGSSNAFNYLQSILQQQSAAGDASAPIVSLLDAFYPASAAAGSSSPAGTSAAGSAVGSDGGAQFSPDTFGALISLQAGDPLAAKAQSLFAGLDGNGDGSISKSEFESAFGSNADMTKVDGLFNALDANGDGSVSQGELTSAVQGSQAHHHHHHHHREAQSADGGGGNGGGGLDALMSAVSGASSQTVNNPDGSTTTTIAYSDGSSVALNTPAASTSATNGASGEAPNRQTVTFNMLEKLIQMQAQMISSPAGADAAAIGLTTSI